VQTAQVAAAGPLAAAGLGVTIIPSNVVPLGLDAAIRPLQPPPMRQLVAFTRQDWPPLAGAFLQALQAQSWLPRPGAATVVP
jgi:DNA-binding transcriptional LysR family regulator